MLVTVSGPSTEWIASQDVQEEILADPKISGVANKRRKKDPPACFWELVFAKEVTGKMDSGAWFIDHRIRKVNGYY